MGFLFNLILLFSIDNNVTVFYSFQINVIFFYQNFYFVNSLWLFKAFYLDTIPSTLYKTSFLISCYFSLYGKHIDPTDDSFLYSEFICSIIPR